jgi:hypothetical protein
MRPHRSRRGSTARAGWALLALVAAVLLAGCDPLEEQERPPRPFIPASVIKRCKASGDPVTVAQMVAVFNRNKVQLVLLPEVCATGDYSGVAQGYGQAGEDVICGVDSYGNSRPDVRVENYPGEEETHVSALNVTCGVYPTDSDHEKEQVREVRAAMAALSAATVPSKPS